MSQIPLFPNLVQRGDRASQPAAGDVSAGTLYCVTDEGNIVERSTGAAWQAYSPTSDGIPETLLDAKGDIIAASAADTAAKVTVGANGTVLKANSAASAGVNWALDQIDSGTSNPGSPTDGDLFWRTDLDQIIFYDGTRWLTVQEYAIPLPRFTTMPTVQFSATTAIVSISGALFTPTNDFFITKFNVCSFVPTTNSGTAYWDFVLKSQNAAGAATTITTATTQSLSPNINLNITVAVNALLGTTELLYVVDANKVSTPGNAYLFSSTVFGRIVIT